MRFEDSISIARPPEVVFDYVVDPANLAQWQTSKTHVEQLTPGPPGPGTRIKERTKPPGGLGRSRMRVPGPGGPGVSCSTWVFDVCHCARLAGSTT